MVFRFLMLGDGSDVLRGSVMRLVLIESSSGRSIRRRSVRLALCIKDHTLM